MTPDTSKPDYSFIMDQPGPNLEAPKRSKKPLIFIGGMITIFVVLIGIALISKKSTNVQQSVAGLNETKTLFGYMASNNVDGAYNSFQPQASLDKTWFTDNFFTPYNQRFDMQSCTNQPKSYQLSDTDAKLVFLCPFKDDKSKTVTLSIIVDRQSEKIKKLEMVTSSS